MASDNARRPEAVLEAIREAERHATLTYWLYNFRTGQKCGGGEGLWNIGWKSGNEPKDVFLLSVDDGNRIEHHALGAGFEIIRHMHPVIDGKD
jgi:hypothetical protein